MTASIWKLKTTAPITKMSIESTVATASLAAAITTLLIATKVIAGPASLALIASPVGIAVLFIAAVYFAALAISSYQQMHKNEEIGVNGKDADFSVLLGDMVKGGTIVEEKKGENDVQQLFLKLSKDAYKALTKGKNENDEVVLNVLFTSSESVEVKFAYVTAADDNGNYQMQLTSVNGKDQPADMKEELIMNGNSSSLKIVLSVKNPEDLKKEILTELQEVAVNATIISKVTSKQF